jgi:hypothetical protein
MTTKTTADATKTKPVRRVPFYVSGVAFYTTDDARAFARTLLDAADKVDAAGGPAKQCFLVTHER